MIIKVCAKCSDLFSMSNDVCEYAGYVPDFFPGEHWGDYLMLDIDTDSGLILNWKKPTKKQLAKTGF